MYKKPNLFCRYNVDSPRLCPAVSPCVTQGVYGVCFTQIKVRPEKETAREMHGIAAQLVFFSTAG